MLKPLANKFRFKNKFYLIVGILIGTVYWISLAQGQGEAPPPALEKVQQTSPEKISGSSDLESLLLPFNYQSEGRRDPFKPYTPPLMKSGDSVRPLNPLEQFDVDELKLVGILWDVRSPRAMVEDPQRQVHIVEKNERIGRNNGFVAAIREGELVVVESVSSVEGPTYSSRIMKIKSKDVK